MPLLQYIGKKPKLIYDPPWLLGGPYVFDKEVDKAMVEVDPVDAADMLSHSPGCFTEVKEEVSATPAQFNCVLCDGVFKSKAGLAAHMKAKHSDEE